MRGPRESDPKQSEQARHDGRPWARSRECCTSSGTPTSTPSGSGSGRRVTRRSAPRSVPRWTSCASTRLIFTCDSAAYYEWIEEIDPGMFDEIQSRVAEGRWEIVGGWWVEPDCNIPSGESFVRHGLISQGLLPGKDLGGSRPSATTSIRSGTTMLPQILRKSGMDSYVLAPRTARDDPALPDLLVAVARRQPRVDVPVAHEYCSSSEDLGYHLDKSLAQLPAHGSR